MNIDKGVIKSYLMLGVIVALVGGLFLTIYVFAIILGSVFHTVQNASLPVTNGTNTFLLATETSFFTNMGYARTAAGFAGGLIAVAIILLIFASFIKTGKGAYEGIASRRRRKPPMEGMGY